VHSGLIMPAWSLLLLAIAAEVVGTSCLKLSNGFSRVGPSLVVLVAYSCSMLLLSRVVQTIPLGITYALWSGIGIIAIVLVGLLVYRQIPSVMQLVGMALITAGVVTVNVSGHGHG
jgi:small multidrug resistance pump